MKTNKIRKIIQILAISSISLLSACHSNVGGDWDCPIQKGGGCSSIRTNAKKAMSIAAESEDELGVVKQQVKSAKSKKEASKQTKPDNEVIAYKVLEKNIKHIDLASEIMDLSSALSDFNKLRSHDKVSRLWFAPFIDEDDNLHQESFVYVVDDNSYWGK